MNVTSVALEGVIPRGLINRLLITQNASTLMNAQTNARLSYRPRTAHPHQSALPQTRSMGATERRASSLCAANIFDMLVLLLLAAALPSALP